MRISELFERERPLVSFEFFPPKTSVGYVRLYRAIEELKRLGPSFVSVTWGAGGSTRRKTVELVTRIERELGITAMAHLTCWGATRSDLAATLDRLAAGGIENVLALRGDPPSGSGKAQAPPGEFRYASQLVELIRSGWDFCIGAACYPETHPEAPSPEADLAHLKQKVEAGVDFLITQLFFDNRDFFAFVERARAIGIRVPIVPGIMPVASSANVRRIAALCGSRIPDELAAELDAAGDDPEAILRVGVAWATNQCRELLDRGVPGIHFYTLNQSPATLRVYENLFR